MGPPLLQREPDGRRAPVALFADVTPLYLSLMLGLPVAAATVAWNALLVRRWVRLLVAAGVGIVGSVACTATLLLLVGAGMDGSLAFFLAQLLAIALGAALYRLQVAVVRGHRLLGGALVPTIPLIIGAFLLQLGVPSLMIWFYHPLLAVLEAAP